MPGEWIVPRRRPPSELAFEYQKPTVIVFAQPDLKATGELFVFHVEEGKEHRAYQVKFFPSSPTKPADSIVKMIDQNSARSISGYNKKLERTAD